MNPNVFKEALKEAEAELDQILIEETAIDERRLELEKRVAKLTENISHLAALADDTTTFKSDVARLNADLGLNGIVMQTINASDEPLTVVEIKERAKASGFNTERYQNFLATLHITLDRLSKNDGPVQKLKDGEGTKVYQRNPNYNPWKRIFDPERMKELLQAKPKTVGEVVADIGKKALQDAIHPPNKEMRDLIKDKK